MKGKSEEDGIPDVEEEEDEEDEIIHETLFTFEAFESVWKFLLLGVVLNFIFRTRDSPMRKLPTHY